MKQNLRTTMRCNSEALAHIFPGTSEMAEIMRKHDWSATPLGDPRHWPDALKIPLRILLTSRFEMWIGWGEDLIFFYNDAYIPTLGMKHPIMLGRPLREVWSEVYDEVADQVARVRSGEATWNKALLLLLERNGYPEETYHSFSYSPLRGADGSVAGLLCVVTEETSRIVSERRLETLSHLGTSLAGVRDKAGLRKAVQSTFAANRRDFPFAALCLAGEPLSQEIATIVAHAKPALPAELTETGEFIALPPHNIWPSGGWDRPPERAIAIAISGPGGSPSSDFLLLGLNPYRPTDPDALEVAQLIAGQIGGALASIAAFQAERRRGDRIWSGSRDLIVVVDAEGIFRSVSPSWTRILGHPADEVTGRHFGDFMHQDDIGPGSSALAQTLAGEELSTYENRLRALDGSYRTIEWHTAREDDLVYAYGRDVTDRLEVEYALSASREQFRHLVQGVTDYAIYMIDLDGRVSSWNEGARRIKGYEPEEIIGEHFSRFYTPEDRAGGAPQRALETARKEGRSLDEGWRVRKSGERFRASVVMDTIRNDAGHPIGYAKITRDVTEREQAQQELEAAREALFQSQKMDAIGRLTGGIAHDFNNLLMAVSSSLDLLRKRVPDDPLTRRLMRNAVEGAQRGAVLTQRMLAFARRQELKVDRIDLPRLLSGMNDLVQRSIGPEWPISTAFPLKLPAIWADANQLEMALLNLIVNARDASPNGGPILVSASCEFDQGKGLGLKEGAYVRLVVKDHGLGMDAETLRRATEPFFTTKGVGKGTGLGLAMVHGMAAQIGGTFELTSELGAGSSAVLWLPVAHEDETTVAPFVRAAEDKPVAPRLTILAVDDDALVLMNMSALLEDLGHEVIEASTAANALDVFQLRDDIDLVITDQAMPNMTGADLIAAMDEVRAGVPTIIASGYGEGVHIGERSVLRLGKPFNQVQLAKAVLEAVENN